MSLKRFFSILSLVTVGALCYTHQQLCLVRLSYVLDERYDRWQIAAQRQSYLKTHVMALASPQQLEQQLARADVRLAFPAQTQLVRVASAPAAPMAMAPGAWFALTAEAEASVDPADLQD